jgi:O-antigen ligase
MPVQSTAIRRPVPSVEWLEAATFRPLHFLLSWPALLYFTTLTAMLFRPPDLHFYDLDRIALALLIGVVGLRALLLRQLLPVSGPITLPLLGLMLVAMVKLLSGAYQAEAWSTFAAKWAIPFLFYHLAQWVFEDGKSFRQFEIFLLIVLAYLSLTAVFFLIGANSLVFPSFILDENLGIHADRARGPFLQAVANGVAITILGLIAVDSYRRGRLRGILAVMFMLFVPVAVLATKTRSVWIAFSGSVLILLVFSSSQRIRRACAYLTIAALLSVSAACVAYWQNASLGARLEERSPIEFRLSLYRAGWEMFQQKPLFGWPADAIQPELAKRVDGFHQEEFFFHNSYLEVAVNYGLMGLVLYLWVFIDLFRVGRKTIVPGNHFLDAKFRALWPVLVGVYLLNASFVVMNYQFVNGLLFTLAGILAAQNRRNAVPAFAD